MLEEEARAVAIRLEPEAHPRIVDVRRPTTRTRAGPPFSLGGSHSSTSQCTINPSKPTFGFGGTRNVK